MIHLFIRIFILFSYYGVYTNHNSSLLFSSMANIKLRVALVHLPFCFYNIQKEKSFLELPHKLKIKCFYKNK